MTPRREEGVSSVELAVLMPVLLFWVLLIVQFGLWFHARHVADAAAAQAVDVARLPDGTARAGEIDAAAILGSAGNLGDATVTVDRTPTVVTAEVQGRAPQLVPGYSWRVTARRVAPVERFDAP